MEWDKRVVSVYSIYIVDTSCFVLLCSGDEWSVWDGILEGYFTASLFQVF